MCSIKSLPITSQGKLYNIKLVQQNVLILEIFACVERMRRFPLLNSYYDCVIKCRRLLKGQIQINSATGGHTSVRLEAGYLII